MCENIKLRNIDHDLSFYKYILSKSKHIWLHFNLKLFLKKIQLSVNLLLDESHLDYQRVGESIELTKLSKIVINLDFSLKLLNPRLRLIMTLLWIICIRI